MSNIQFGGKVMHRPMELWEVFSVFGSERGLLEAVFRDGRWKEPYLSYLHEADPLERDVLTRFVPLALSRELAARSSGRYRVREDSRDNAVYWLRADAADPDAPEAAPWSDCPVITALEVHERFGGAVIEEVFEKGSCDVTDDDGWQERWPAGDER